MFIVKYNYEAMKRYRRIREYSSHCAKKKKKASLKSLHSVSFYLYILLNRKL